MVRLEEGTDRGTDGEPEIQTYLSRSRAVSGSKICVSHPLTVVKYPLKVSPEGSKCCCGSSSSVTPKAPARRQFTDGKGVHTTRAIMQTI